jgi:hypothetical protein
MMLRLALDRYRASCRRCHNGDKLEAYRPSQAGSLTSHAEFLAPKGRAKTRESAIVIKDGEQEKPLP